MPSTISAAMERSTSLRPPRPTRCVPHAPLPIETSDLPSSPESDDVRYPTSLATPPVESICADYLKNELVHLDFQRKLDALVTAPTNGVSALSYLGQPFTAPPKGVRPQDVPFLRFFCRRLVLTFPLPASAPKLLPDKVQCFLASLLSRNL